MEKRHRALICCPLVGVGETKTSKGTDSLNFLTPKCLCGCMRLRHFLERGFRGHILSNFHREFLSFCGSYMNWVLIGSSCVRMGEWPIKGGELLCMESFAICPQFLCRLLCHQIPRLL